jgi:glycyl-tRNA synthetase beta chain
MKHQDLLIEIGTEELPPKALRELELSFAREFAAGLERVGLTHSGVHSYAAPRRLALNVSQLAPEQPEQNLKRRGPSVAMAFDSNGQPTRAAQAFANSCGVDVPQLQQLDEDKGPALYFISKQPGATAHELVPTLLVQALDALPIPKRMRWGNQNTQFVRPVHWIVVLYGKEVLSTPILGLTPGRITYGHRFHSTKPLSVASAGNYPAVLQNRGHIIADFLERKDKIRTGVQTLAAQSNATALIEDALLEEVTALVDWPVPLKAQFDARFLVLPREVLISTLQAHQRYFPLQDANGKLLPQFITVSNIASREPQQVQRGNEKVIYPRLADAEFFWQQDRKHSLASRCPALNTIAFQERLGSMGDKARRVMTLASAIAAQLQSSTIDAARAAELCKCDLLTALVGEFPDLQGIVGAYYAAADGESPEVATAIREHYLPRGAQDQVARSAAGIAVALADKLDTLTGIFSLGQKPSGTKDPFGLRRAALGIVRTVLENTVELDLSAALEQANAQQPVPGTSKQIYDYIFERLRSYYLENIPQATPERFDAVWVLQPRSLLDAMRRLEALALFLTQPEAASLTAANKRISNLILKNPQQSATTIEPRLLRHPAEQQLFNALTHQQTAVPQLLHSQQYIAALNQLALLRPEIDAFFEQVLVMDEDPAVRSNRLALLSQVRQLFNGVADLSQLPG